MLTYNYTIHSVGFILLLLASMLLLYSWTFKFKDSAHSAHLLQKSCKVTWINSIVLLCIYFTVNTEYIHTTFDFVHYFSLCIMSSCRTPNNTYIYRNIIIMVCTWLWYVPLELTVETAAAINGSRGIFMICFFIFDVVVYTAAVSRIYTVSIWQKGSRHTRFVIWVPCFIFIVNATIQIRWERTR